MCRVLQKTIEFMREFPNLQAREDELNFWLQDLRSAIYLEPIQVGHADALFAVGTIFGSGLTLNHDYETFNLMAYALRSTLANKELGVYILINLSHACVFQKSFEEAYQYGKLAEKFLDSDDDLLANLIIACTATNRIQEAKRLSNQLKQINKMKLASVNEILMGEGPLQPIQKDCPDPLLDLNDAILLLHNGNQDMATEKMREATIKLEECPNGLNAWKSWKMLGEFYISEKNRSTEIESLEYIARATAAFGKMIAFYPTEREIDPKFILWLGQSLCQLGFYSLAINYLEKALSGHTRDEGISKAINDTLNYCKQLSKK
jgi:tetratricopeptide (TPR) repeat protein